MTREAQVGDRSYRIEPFNGRKAILAGRMVARIAKRVPGLLEADGDFQRKYSEANAVRVTRSMALGVDGWKERLGDITDEEWKQLGGVLVLPHPPTFELRLAAVFMEAFETAEEEVLKLLALTVIPNGDLADAASQNSVKEVLLEWSGRLMDNGTLVELVDLAAVAAEQVRDEFEAGGGGLGKLRALWQGQGAEAETPAPQPMPSPAPMPTPAPQPTPPTPAATSRESTSSTDSPTPTDGDTDESSTKHRGVFSSASVTS